MSKNTKPTSIHTQSGQALVEFALVLLFVILPLMFVLTDGALTLYTYSVVTNAAREGAREGSIYQATTAPDPHTSYDAQVTAIDTAREAYINQKLQTIVGGLVTYSECSTTITYRPDRLDPYNPDRFGNPYRQLDSLTVRLACPRQLLFGLIGAPQITLSAQSTMTIEPGGVAP